jgi:hypothetical protein
LIIIGGTGTGDAVYSTDEGRGSFPIQADPFDRQNRTTGISEIALPPIRICRGHAIADMRLNCSATAQYRLHVKGSLIAHVNIAV